MTFAELAPKAKERRAYDPDALGEKRGLCLDLHKACGFLNRKSTRDAIRLRSRKNGYTIKGTEAGVQLAR